MYVSRTSVYQPEWHANHFEMSKSITECSLWYIFSSCEYLRFELGYSWSWVLRTDDCVHIPCMMASLHFSTRSGSPICSPTGSVTSTATVDHPGIVISCLQEYICCFCSEKEQNISFSSGDCECYWVNCLADFYFLGFHQTGHLYEQLSIISVAYHLLFQGEQQTKGRQCYLPTYSEASHPDFGLFGLSLALWLQSTHFWLSAVLRSSLVPCVKPPLLLGVVTGYVCISFYLGITVIGAICIFFSLELCQYLCDLLLHCGQAHQLLWI
ncbi:hypothetical protein Pelo_14781 [Pelomyxa schiedti]|nr:hypothetical protein Pelo_14781 [Pelomyxa schiedti]